MNRADAAYLARDFGAFACHIASAFMLGLVADLLFRIPSNIAAWVAFVIASFAVAFVLIALLQLIAFSIALYGVLTK